MAVVVVPHYWEVAGYFSVYNRYTSAEVLLHWRLSHEFTMSFMILIMASWNPNDVICVSTLSFRSRNTRALILAPKQKYRDCDAIMQARIHVHKHLPINLLISSS